MSVVHNVGASAKRIGRRILDERILGVVDYYIYPERRNSWGGPFNGQPFRQELFLAMIDVVKPTVIIETGTYLGTTTDFMAATDLPVFTVEGHARNYGFARARLWRRRNVKLFLGDSRQVLRSLFAGPLRNILNCSLFFYLDAHWNADLPLGAELDIIYTCCASAVVMIDDFHVPDEAGYGYDDYGSGNAITFDYIRRVLERYQLTIYYPSIPAIKEGGRRRGCAVLVRDLQQNEAMDSLSTLRRAEFQRSNDRRSGADLTIRFRR